MSAMIWAAYERVSTEEQAEEGHSIQVQKEGIERYLKTKGDQLYRHYTDAGLSGASMERPELQALLEDARAGKFQGVVVHKTDRLSRKLRDILNIVESLKEMGIAFWTIDQGYDTSTPQGRLLFHQLASFADFERNMIVDRTMAGLKKRAELGKYTSAQSPYGYDYDPKTGKLSINEKEAGIVRDLYHWVVYERMSGRQACMRLIERGVPTKNAGRGKSGRRSIWRTSTIWTMLKNTTYYGQAFYRKCRAVPAKQPRKGNGAAPHKNNGRILRAESERIPISVPAIIDKALYDRAQERLRENLRFSKKNRVHDRPLRGLVSCGECGTSMEPVLFVSKTGKHYWKYRCRGRAYPELQKNCRIPHVKALPFEEKVWTKFLDLLKEPGVLLGWAEADQKLKGSRDQAQKELSALRTRKNFLATQEESIKSAFRLGGFTPEQFAEEMKRLGGEREKLERTLAAVEASLGKVSRAESEAVTETCRNLYNTALGMNAAERQECLKLLFKQGISSQL
ncbi:MAG: recombinase family protein [Thermodesulfobacteriota bacterium]